MRRHNIEISRTASLCQIGCLVLMLVAVLVVLVHDIAYRDPSGLARAMAMMMNLVTLTF